MILNMPLTYENIVIFKIIFYYSIIACHFITVINYFILNIKLEINKYQVKLYAINLFKIYNFILSMQF